MGRPGFRQVRILARLSRSYLALSGPLGAVSRSYRDLEFTNYDLRLLQAPLGRRYLEEGFPNAVGGGGGVYGICRGPRVLQCYKPHFTERFCTSGCYTRCYNLQQGATRAGMLEYWNGGMVEYWNGGMVENWNGGGRV